MKPTPTSSPWHLATRTARMNPSAIREILKLTELPGIISLAGGIDRNHDGIDTHFLALATRDAHGAHEQGDDQRSHRGAGGHRADQRLPLAEPGEDVGQREHRRALFVFALVERLGRGQRRGGVGAEHPDQLLSEWIAAMPMPKPETICAKSLRFLIRARPQVS